jgi:copper chaperone
MILDMETQTLAVPDISCDHCKMSIEGATAALAGVAESSVDIPAKTVTVSYEAATIGLDEIVSAIEDQGYEVAR